MTLFQWILGGGGGRPRAVRGSQIAHLFEFELSNGSVVVVPYSGAPDDVRELVMALCCELPAVQFEIRGEVFEGYDADAFTQALARAAEAHTDTRLRHAAISVKNQMTWALIGKRGVLDSFVRLETASRRATFVHGALSPFNAPMEAEGTKDASAGLTGAAARISTKGYEDALAFEK